MKNRCGWVKLTDPIEVKYHDEEWGVPLHNDEKLFEFIVLDSFQAGLSWNIILKKRENFRRALDGFDANLIAQYDEAKRIELSQDKGIIRNKLKIKAVVTNAQAFLSIQKEFGTFDKYIWQFTEGKTIINKWENRALVPTTSLESDAMSKDLKKRGFKFVGSTICYAFMQAAGMIQDHTIDCFRYKDLI